MKIYLVIIVLEMLLTHCLGKLIRHYGELLSEIREWKLII